MNSCRFVSSKKELKGWHLSKTSIRTKMGFCRDVMFSSFGVFSVSLHYLRALAATQRYGIFFTSCNSSQGCISRKPQREIANHTVFIKMGKKGKRSKRQAKEQASGDKSECRSRYDI